MWAVLRTLPAFLSAVLVCSVLAAVFQTQFNLAALQNVGLEVSLGLRIKTTLLDILGFAPFFALLVSCAYALALPIAVWLGGYVPKAYVVLCMLTGTVGVWCALALANGVAPMPTLIAADRTLWGTSCLLLAAALGAWVFGYVYKKVISRAYQHD